MKKKAKRGRKFKFHGAFKSKAKARKKERSRECNKCFILPRKIGKRLRYLVLGAK